ncbi:hypothetical protein METESE_06910 [Mesoterricola sediminis]|uniref:Uncharacterized protein n=2 Tax=Mesoterricola sediminis TaxID=2927980 RepID=A0AA48H4B2_9BACT|nr:hypothetical protein METESE_06910 [Mesoterricola sediminis]
MLKNICDIIWHIEYHLSNPYEPHIDVLGPMHKAYVQFQEKLESEVEELLSRAKEIDPKEFDTKFREKDFNK